MKQSALRRDVDEMSREKDDDERTKLRGSL
jgi:hypothetical protein